MSHKNIYLASQEYPNTKIRKIYVYGVYIKPIADAKVVGQINNQFSLDEYKNVLRVATTNNWPLSNNVFCLDYYLKPYGQLTGIAPGEKIYSTRYSGNRMFMVTFRQVDPFFVIDLSNQKQPRVVGELKIPGFSRYLQPYDENTIVGFGREADEKTGRPFGLKIGIFNVTDSNNPTSTYSWSI